MQVSDLARAAGVTPDTVRHYLRIGLLHADRNPLNDYRRFGRQHLGRLEFIRNAVQLGFSLAEVRAIFDAAEDGKSPCPRVRDLLATHIAETEARIQELQRSLDRMLQAMATWDRMPNATPDGESVCHLIEYWNRTKTASEVEE